MSEKLIITKEQHDAVIKALGNRKGDRAQLIGDHSVVRGCEEHGVLNELTVSDVVRIVYDGDYEIEKPKFKPGDKVFWVSRDGSIREFCEIDRERTGEGEPCWWFTDGDWGTEKRLHHATPEEIYWLHELGRDKVPDFHENDVVVDERGLLYTIGNEIDAEVAAEWYSNSNIQGIYPAESFKPFKKESE